MRNLLCLLGLILLAAGCATKPANPPTAGNASAKTGPLQVLEKNLRSAYPPLESYFALTAEVTPIKVFESIDEAGYTCRVFALSKGRTRVGEVAADSGFAPPTLTEIRYQKDHDVKARFSDVKKIQASPSTPPPSAGANFPAYTDVSLLDRHGVTLDTITVGAASAGEVTSALLALCPNAQ